MNYKRRDLWLIPQERARRQKSFETGRRESVGWGYWQATSKSPGNYLPAAAAGSGAVPTGVRKDRSSWFAGSVETG
jgi:hypothetical protein